MKKLIYILFLLSNLSCNNEVNEKPLIHENEMVNILYDLHITEAYVSQLTLNTSNTLDSLSYYKELVFKKHNTSELTFDQSMDYYSRYPEILEKIYEDVKKQIQELDLTIPHLDDNNKSIDSIKPRNNLNDHLHPFTKKKKP